MLSLPYTQTSVFVDPRYSFGGNQLATFWDVKKNKHLSHDQMQGIALEMNFSETTFIETPTLKDCQSKVRIFTPAAEVPFAGHPTLGSAFVIQHQKLIDPTAKTTTLELKVGAIPIDYLSNELIRMSQPQPQFLKEWSDHQSVAESLNLSVDDIHKEYPIQFVSTGLPFLIVPLTSLAAVKNAQPDTATIVKHFSREPSREILIYSLETEHKDSMVHARMFAPMLGVLEDPATGSAAGPLAAYLEHHNILVNHKSGEPIKIEQGYEIRRPSQLIAEVAWTKKIDSVLVSGRVQLIAEGTFFLGS